MPWRSSLATRSAALYSGLVAAAVLFAGWLIYSGNRSEVLEARERDLEHRARTVQVRIDTEVQAVVNDLRFLSKAQFLRRLADASEEDPARAGLIADAQRTFAALLEGKPSYAQSRLLDETGHEIIRLDQLEGEVVASPPDALQDKGHRDYFQESTALEPGQVYLSRINLNQEFGKVSLPHTPTLRAAAKVFNNSGRTFGLVVINIDLRPLFSELATISGSETSLYLANREGDYLVHPNPAQTFGFDLGARHRLQQDYGPDPVQAPKSEDEIVRFLRFPFGPDRAAQLVVGVGIPRETVLAELAVIQKRSLASALVAAVLAAGMVWIFAFLLSRRLNALADAIGRYEPGAGTASLPGGGNDEVAVVARKFSQLAGKIDEQVAALDRARQLADENREAKEEFLASLSHEIRTAMNPVTGMVHTLESSQPEPHQLPILRSLAAASQKLIAVVNDVLDFSKIEAGQLTFRSAPFDLHELLEGLRMGHASQSQEAGLAFTVEWDRNVPRTVSGDSLRLYQILNNLVHNALRFTPRGGRVEVHAERLPDATATPGRVVLSFRVQDTGIGMTPNELDHAQARFGQAGADPSGKPGGTGLGLPIARMLVESQGGSFTAISERGKGSCFTFQLSFAEAEDESLAPTTPRVPDLSGIRLLCVEDVASNQQVVSALLEPSGVELNFAASGAETREILQRMDHDGHSPDLLLLDLQLPDCDGASLAAEIRAQWPDLTMVGLTAQTSGSLLEKCRAAGVRTFLWKPIEPDRFFQTIAGAVHRSSDQDPMAEPDLTAVAELFDGNRDRIERYLASLADELEIAAGVLPGHAAEHDTEAISALRHRLQNGLTMIGDADLLGAIEALASAAAGQDSSSEAERCRHLLTHTAAQLRAHCAQATSTASP